MTECECESDGMITKEECENARAPTFWGGVLCGLTASLGVVIVYKLTKADSRLAEMDLRLERLVERLG